MNAQTATVSLVQTRVRRWEEPRWFPRREWRTRRRPRKTRAAISFVQSAHNATTGVATCAKAFTSNNTAGNLLVIAIGMWKSGSFATPKVTDSKGNVWKKVITGPRPFVSGQSQCFIFAAPNCAAGANTVTVTSSVVADIDMAIHEYSGAATLNPLDQNFGVQAPGSLATTGFSLQTNFANEVLFCFGYDQSSNTSVFTSSSGWTGREQTSNPDGATLKTFDKIVSSAGTYSNSMLDSNTASNAFHVLAASFSDTSRPSALVQSKSAGVVGTSLSIAFDSNNASGNLLVFAIGCWNATAVGTITVTDSAGNTLVLLASTSASASGQSKAFLYYVPSCLAGANTVTVSSTSSDSLDLAIHEYASPVSAPIFSAVVNDPGTPVTTVSSATLSTLGTGVMFSFMYNQSNFGDSGQSTFSGLGWQMCENSSDSGGSSLGSWTQLPGSGGFAQSITTHLTSLALHLITVAFTGAAVLPPPVTIFVST